MPGESPSFANDQERLRLLTALRESEILREFAELLASSLDLDHILQIIVKRTTQVSEVERCAIWLLEDSRAVLRPVVYHLSAQHINKRLFQTANHLWYRSVLPLSDPIMHRLFHEKGMLYLKDLHAEPTLRTVAETFLVHSILLVALVREGRPVGMMSLDNPGQVNPFSAEQQQLAHAIGQQAAMAIDNAQLYKQAQTERRRAEQLNERAQAIYQVAMAVNSGEDLSTILGIATPHMIHGLDADRGTFVLLDSGVLYPLSTPTALQTTLDQRAPTNLTELPFCYQAALTGTPTFIAAKRLGVAELLWYNELGLENALIIPLMAGGTTYDDGAGSQRCVGFAFANYHSSRHHPSQEHLAFAQDIAAQCALAIEKSHLLHHAHQAAVLATERANTLNAVFDAMTEGISVLDQNGQVQLRNNAAAKFLGEPVPAQERLSNILKRHAVFTLHGQQISEDEFPLTRAIRGERVWGERYLLARADGVERVVEFNVAPLLDDREQQVGVVSAFRDVTVQTRIEQHIRQALETMLHMAEAVSGITAIDDILDSILRLTLTALKCERGAVQIHDPEQKSFVPLLVSDAATDTAARQHLSEEKKWLTSELYQRAEFQRQLQQGHAILLNPELHAHLLRSATQAPTTSSTNVLTLVVPITHNNQLLGLMFLDRFLPMQYKTADPPPEQQSYEFTIWDMAIIEGIAQLAGLAIEQARWQQEAIEARTNEAAMREANALKDEFLAITAHEFRTPLTLILAHTQVALRSLRKEVTPEKLSRLNENLLTIEEQTHNLTNIVNTFLEATQINRGQLILNNRPVDLAEIACQIASDYRTTATNHQIRCTVAPDAHPYLVQGDRARLQQVIANLVQNALKYSPNGGPVILTARQHMEEQGKRCIEIAVEDQGIGVPLDAQSHLFERFYRAPNIQMSKTRGIGLGLYVVAEILRMHGGTIRVESSGIPGEGSRFIFTLPALESETHTFD